jgi:hypothetical protein
MGLLMQMLIHMFRVTAAVDEVVRGTMALLILSGVVALTMTIRTLITHEIIHPGDEAGVRCIENDKRDTNIAGEKHFCYPTLGSLYRLKGIDLFPPHPVTRSLVTASCRRYK